jgi:hypothetical protein
MEIKEIKKLEKNFAKFCCEVCNFKCSQKCDWERHIIRAKHVDAHIGNQKEIKKLEKTFFCNCGKKFITNSGLWKHKSKKTCLTKNYSIKEEFNCKTKEEKKETSAIDINDKDQLILFLIKQNSELIKEQGSIKQMMIEQQNIVLEIAKNGTNNTTTTHTNSHNKAFNLNLFLNETCKDAMNIMDFVESINLQLSDLEGVGEKGYIEGISNIIVKNLKALDITQRPVHCTDKKRETLYVKDDNKWEKDDENVKMHKMIRKVQDKNFRMIKKFKEKYPEYYKASSKQSDVYNNIIIESMGGKGDNDFEKEEKIIKKVSKEVVIDK